MTPENFAYWIKGYFELEGGETLLTPRQTRIIQDHLDLVFKKETPDRDSGLSLDIDTKSFGQSVNVGHYEIDKKAFTPFNEHEIDFTDPNRQVSC